MSKTLKPNCEYFVSHCVMTEDCNPLGHSFLLISCIDHSKGKDTKVEVIEAVGFYSTKGPVIGFKLKGPGRIECEEAKYFVEREGISHKTFQITHEQLAQLLAKINQDRRTNIIRSKQRGQYTGGPVFNAYQGHNCKNYALECLKSIGIEAEALRSTYQIPKLSKNHHPLRMTHQLGREKADPHAIFWDCELKLTEGNKEISDLEQDKVILQEKRNTLYEGIKNIEFVLTQRQTELRAQNKKSKSIDESLKTMADLKKRYEKDIKYPNRVDEQYIHQKAKCIEQAVNKCANKFFEKNKEVSFAWLLLDLVSELLSKLQSRMTHNRKLQEEIPNQIDKKMAHAISGISHAVKCKVG